MQIKIKEHVTGEIALVDSEVFFAALNPRDQNQKNVVEFRGRLYSIIEFVESGTGVETDASLQGDGTTLSPLGLPYKLYVAKGDQNMANAPVFVVNENTLSGTPVWSRATDGIYLLTLAGEFPTGSKVEIFHSGSAGAIEITNPGGTYASAKIISSVINANSIAFQTFYDGQVPTDSLIQGFSLEIRVYP